MAKLERWMAVYDNHGNMQDPATVEVIRGFRRSFKPTMRIHGGDAWNFAALRKNASPEERCEPMKADIELGSEFVSDFNPKVLLRGNHDERLWDMLKSVIGTQKEDAERIINDISKSFKGALMLPYDKRAGVFQYGDTRFIHGYSHGAYAARAAAMSYGTVVMGHVHTNDCQSVPTLEGAVGYSIGCACVVDQSYNRGHLGTLRQQAGFSYGFKLSSGSVIVYQAKPVDGVWYLPTEFNAVEVP